MSREISRKSYFDRGGGWDRNYYKSQTQRKRSRTPSSREGKRRSRSPQKSEKDILDDNIITEISKLPEPNELWDNQFQEGFSGNAPPPFTRDGGNYPSNYQQPYSVGYESFGGAMAPIPASSSGWNQVPVPSATSQPVLFNNVEDQIKKEAAIESEMRHQKAALSKQREDCMKKANILKKELETLKEQRSELHSDTKRSPSPDTKRFLKENTKLQLEIQNKLKTINNVVDMLNGIIGEEAEKNEVDDSMERSTKRKSRSPSSKKFNYVYYDPEMHWCRVCNEFPATAKDYLTHLHSPSHHKMASSHMEAPWHSVPGMNEGFPSYPSAPTKRTPIRGLQFFVPSTAWYCKLCDQFIGDLHCASAHLKSLVHSNNYANFVEQNPHWDTDWMSDRQKAFEKSRGKSKAEETTGQYTAHTITFSKDGFHTKRKASPAPSAADKKKKKNRKKKKNKRRRSSSSSTTSSSSESDHKTRKKKKESAIDKAALSQWMSSVPTHYGDKKLLDNLKFRVEKDNRKTTSRENLDRHEDVRSESRKEDRPERREERQNDRQEVRDERTEKRDDRSDRREGQGAKDERGERRSDGHEPRDSRSRSTQQGSEVKKPEIKKMPFIGKMPVFKNLAKNTKNEEQKKDDEKKKHDEEVIKKRREEMDAEIQKKVAIFKEKIAKAQLEKQQQELTPPLALQQLGFLPPPAALAAPIPPPQVPNNLPKDFQDALDIIFPSNTKPADLPQQEVFVPSLPPGFAPVPTVPYTHMGLVQPPMSQMSPMSPMVMGFDLNAQLFPPAHPQLYDTQVPIVPGHKQKVRADEGKEPNRDLDELAMLGIDASDVGAGI